MIFMKNISGSNSSNGRDCGGEMTEAAAAALDMTDDNNNTDDYNIDDNGNDLFL